MKVYKFGQGNSHIDIHHDGSLDLFVPGCLAMRIEPTELEDVAGLLTHAAVISQRMHLDISTMPGRCPFRKRDGLAFGERCLREPHGDTEHVFDDVSAADTRVRAPHGELYCRIPECSVVGCTDPAHQRRPL